MEMSVQMRTYFVLGVMFTCFAILYPKIFHPMILSALGWNRPPPSHNEYMHHPRDRMMHGPGGRSPAPSMPSRPHPGMRMGGDSATSTRTTSSSRGGVMSMVLPIYAIGIVLYLIYTLVKVFGGGNGNNKNKERREAILREYYRNFHYDADKGEFRLGHGSDDEQSDGGEGEARGWKRQASGKSKSHPNTSSSGTDSQASTAAAAAQRSLPRDLERLLRKVDDKNITETEMRDLRDRLEETERQMTRILEAMKEVQARVDNGPENAFDEEGPAKEDFADDPGALDDAGIVEEMGSSEQTVRCRKGGKAAAEKRKSLDSSDSEPDEFVDLDDGYEAEAEERDDEEVKPSSNVSHKLSRSPPAESVDS